MCILIGKRLAVFRKCRFSLHSFLVRNAKIAFFEEKKGFERIFFYRIELHVVTNYISPQASRLGKAPNICIFYKCRLFMKF